VGDAIAPLLQQARMSDEYWNFVDRLHSSMVVAGVGLRHLTTWAALGSPVEPSRDDVQRATRDLFHVYDALNEAMTRNVLVDVVRSTRAANDRFAVERMTRRESFREDGRSALVLLQLTVAADEFIDSVGHVVLTSNPLIGDAVSKSHAVFGVHPEPSNQTWGSVPVLSRWADVEGVLRLASKAHGEGATIDRLWAQAAANEVRRGPSADDPFLRLLNQDPPDADPDTPSL
jgi:hypothetical protein